MLVLSVREGDSLYIHGTTIRVKVCSVEGKCIRMGLDLPEGVDAVTEKELVKRARAKKKEDLPCW